MPIPCPQCATENRHGDRFCRCCGCALDGAALLSAAAKRRRTCRPCGAANKPSAHFCAACGVRLDAAAPAVPTGAGVSRPPAPPSRVAAAAAVPAAAVPALQPAARETPARNGLVVGAVLLVLALAAAVGWSLQRAQPAGLAARSAGVPAAGATPALPAGMSAIEPQEAVSIAPPPAPVPALESDPAPAVPASAAAPAPPAARRPAPDPASAERTRRTREANRAAGAAPRERADALERPRGEAETPAPPRVEQERTVSTPAAAAVPPDSVRQLCAARGNVISEQLCRSRECRKPEFAADAVCVRLREMQEARQRSSAQP